MTMGKVNTRTKKNKHNDQDCNNNYLESKIMPQKSKIIIKKPIDRLINYQ